VQKDNWINKISYVLVQTQVADDHFISDQEIADDASKYNKLNITLRSIYELIETLQLVDGTNIFMCENEGSEKLNATYQRINCLEKIDDLLNYPSGHRRGRFLRC